MKFMDVTHLLEEVDVYKVILHIKQVNLEMWMCVSCLACK